MEPPREAAGQTASNAKRAEDSSVASGRRRNGFYQAFCSRWGILIVASCIIVAMFYIASRPSAALLPGKQTADNHSNSGGQAAPLPPVRTAANPEGGKTDPLPAEPKNVPHRGASLSGMSERSVSKGAFSP
jgi:hypothetical protein